MKCLTVDQALKILQKAKNELGGDATLILSLTDSGISDVNVNDMALIKVDESRYVEVRVFHQGVNDSLNDFLSPRR